MLLYDINIFVWIIQYYMTHTITYDSYENVYIIIVLKNIRNKIIYIIVIVNNKYNHINK